MILITGATGYLGRALGETLVRRGHAVRALVRPGSESRAPRGAELALGDALQPDSVTAAALDCHTLVHLIGTPHPASWKQRQFEQIDRASLFASVEAAIRQQVAHFVYVSVAHPAPIMHGYINIRRQCEDHITSAGLHASILRPWYVLGPGHRWPVVLLPLYWLAGQMRSTRPAARRLGLVTHAEMVAALTAAIENPPSPDHSGGRVWGPVEIRAATAAVDSAPDHWAPGH
jgi:uncharacterized protein YbjT (DUF2867 family)